MMVFRDAHEIIVCDACYRPIVGGHRAAVEPTSPVPWRSDGHAGVAHHTRVLHFHDATCEARYRPSARAKVTT